MSFQEKAVTTANGDHEQQEVETPQVSWFKKTFPHFFSPRVVEARSKSAHQTPKAQANEMLVTRKLSEKKTTYATLQKDGGLYLFKLGCGTKLPVPRYTLQNATSAVGGEWVRIKIGSEVLRLKRTELRTAFTTLDAI